MIKNQNTITGEEVFISEVELRRRLGISRRTAHNWRKSATAKLPFVRVPGSRLIRYHWPTIQNFLLRQQKNGGDL
jgi:hypothetical protein